MHRLGIPMVCRRRLKGRARSAARRLAQAHRSTERGWLAALIPAARLRLTPTHRPRQGVCHEGDRRVAALTRRHRWRCRVAPAWAESRSSRDQLADHDARARGAERRRPGGLDNDPGLALTDRRAAPTDRGSRGVSPGYRSAARRHRGSPSTAKTMPAFIMPGLCIPTSAATITEVTSAADAYVRFRRQPAERRERCSRELCCGLQSRS